MDSKACKEPEVEGFQVPVSATGRQQIPQSLIPHQPHHIR